MSLEQAVANHSVTEVVHFTTNRGLVGSLAGRSLLSRPLLREDDYLRHVLQLNSETRPEESAYFDKSEDWLRFVNLSVSEINRRFLEASFRWHDDGDLWWCILAFEPEIITHDGVWFTTTNNGYDQCQRGQGEEGFEAMFAPSVSRKACGVNGRPWNVSRHGRGAHLPTCEQAEVLYPEQLSLDHLQQVYVQQDEHHDTAVGWLNEFGYPDVTVSVSNSKFAGKKN